MSNRGLLRRPVRYAHLPRARTLRLSALHMNDQDASDLARALRGGALPALRALHLDRNALAGPGAAAVAEAWVHRRRGAGPQYIELGYNPDIYSELPRILAALAAPRARKLRYLGLGHVGWNEENEDYPCMERLCRETLPNVAASLEELVLECNEIGLPAVRALARCAARLPLPRLHTLDVSDNTPTFAQTRHLENMFQNLVPSLRNVELCCGM